MIWKIFVFIATGIFILRQLYLAHKWLRDNSGKYAVATRLVVVDFTWEKDNFRKPLMGELLEKNLKEFALHCLERTKHKPEEEHPFVRTEVLYLRKRYYGIFGEYQWKSGRNGCITADLAFIDSIVELWKRDRETEIIQCSKTFDLWKRRTISKKFGI